VTLPQKESASFRLSASCGKAPGAVSFFSRMKSGSMSFRSPELGARMKDTPFEGEPSLGDTGSRTRWVVARRSMEALKVGRGDRRA
jgi:hypothetical protein